MSQSRPQSTRLTLDRTPRDHRPTWALWRAVVAVTLAMAGGLGFGAGLAGAAPAGAPAASPAAAVLADITERLDTLRLYGYTVVCNSCIVGEANRPATAGSNTVIDPNTQRVPEDPPYTDPTGPFSPLSPEAPEFDYVTWDPAWISERLNEPAFRAQWNCLRATDEVSRDANIRASGVNGSQKVWLRHWYEPTHLDKDLNADDCLTDSNNNGTPDAPVNPAPSNQDEWYPAIMTELTYQLLDNELPVAHPDPDRLDDSAPRPICGRAGETRFVFPIGTSLAATDPAGPLVGDGLTSLDVDFDGTNDMVNVGSEITTAADTGITIDFDGDGVLDNINTDGVPLSCDEMVVLSTDSITIHDGSTVQFLDHFVRVRNVSAQAAVLEVWYNGDLRPRLVQARSVGIDGLALAADVGPLQVVQPGANLLGQLPIGPFYVYVQGTDALDGTVTLVLGRALGAPCASMESTPNVANRSVGGPWFLKRFYVDGHEYNVVAIMTCAANAMQYITLRSPLPKVDVTIEQHSVRLEGYGVQEPLVLPPPFNHEHTILEDVVDFEGFDLCPILPGDDEVQRPEILYMGGPMGPIPPVLAQSDPLVYTGRHPERPVGPYDNYFASHWFYTEEEGYEPFIGQIREKYGALNTGGSAAPPPGVPDSFFFNEQVFTQPWRYTEFVMPDQAGAPLAGGVPACDPDNYLVTTGFTNDTARWRLWRMPDGSVPDEQPPTPPDLVVDETLFDPATGAYGSPRRVTFVHDPDDNKGKLTADNDGLRLYGGFPVCDDLTCNGIVSRPPILFGAGDTAVATDATSGLAAYPVEVLPYTDPFAPVNPQHPHAPRTDSLTFNPAYMDEFRNFNEPLRELYQQISNGAQNAREKVYHRTWYQPDWVEKLRFTDDCQRDLQFPAIVQEYTYLMMDTTDNPVGVPAGSSRIAFPVGSRAADLPAPNPNGTLPAGGQFGYGLTTFDANFDGFNDASNIHSEQTLNQYLDQQWQSNRPTLPGVPVTPLAGPMLDFDGDQVNDALDADCQALNGNEMAVFAVQSLTLDLDPNTPEGHNAQFLDYLITLNNVTPNTRAQFRLFFTGGNPNNARPEAVGGIRTLDIGDAVLVDRFQDRVTIVRPGEANTAPDGAWFAFVEDVAPSGDRVTLTVGRALGASHSAIDDGNGSHDLLPGDPWYLKRFHVDGHSYNVVAIMTQNSGAAGLCNDTFAFITIRTPVPKGNFINPQDSLFYQGYFLNGLPPQMSVLPPFNMQHTLAMDIDRLAPEDFAFENGYVSCVGELAPSDPLVETILEETDETRLHTELRETYAPADAANARVGWNTHQLMVTPSNYTTISVPEGQKYLLTLAWTSPVSKLAFYGCTRDEPGPFFPGPGANEFNPPPLDHNMISAAGDTWAPPLGILPPVNNPNPPQVHLFDDEDNATVGYFDGACPLGGPTRVKVFYDPADTDDIYINTRDVTVPVDQADLEITKQASTLTPVAGGALVYTISVKNNGPDPVTDVTVRDILPAGVVYVSDSDGCVEGPVGTLTCTFGSIAVGQTRSFTVNVELDMMLAVGTVLTNTATVFSTSTLDTNLANNTATAVVTTTRAADLAIAKSASIVTPRPGDQVVYQILVTNNGPSDATNVQVVDTLPASLLYVSSNGACVQAPVGTVTCTIGALAAGATAGVAITVQVAPGAQTGAILTNTATVQSSTLDPTSGNNQAQAAVIVAAAADLRLTKTASAGPYVAGGEVTFTLVAANFGPSAVNNAQVTDVLPVGMTYVSDDAGCVQAPPGTLTCSLGPLASGQTRTIHIVARINADVAPGASLNNTAVVAAAGVSDPVPANNTSSATVVAVASADLRLTKSAPPTVVAGGALAYNLTVFNAGPSNAVNVVVVDTLPAGVTYVSDNAGCVQAPVGTLTCALGDIAAGASRSITINVTVGGLAAGTQLVNLATVDSDTPDPDGANSSASTTTTVGGASSADLSLAKTGPASVQAGNTIAYNLTVSNAGPDTANGVTVNDTLPAGTTFVGSAPAVCSLNPPASQNLSCSLGNIAAGGSAGVVVTIQTGAGQAGTTLTNTASVTSSTLDPAAGNNNASAQTVVNPASGSTADLALTKAAPAQILAGQQMVYQLTVTNNGPSQANNVLVSDVLPLGVSFVSTTGPNGCTSGGGGTRLCALGNLPSGQSIQFNIVVDVDGAVPAGAQLTNTAVVSSGTVDPTPGNNGANATTTVTGTGQGADLQITKTSPSPTVTPGMMHTFNLLVENLGPANAPSVIVIDQLPAGFSYLSDTAGPGGTSGCVQGPPQTLTCNLGALNNGQSRLFTMTVQVGAGVPNGAQLTNVASVAHGKAPLAASMAVDAPERVLTDDPNPGNNEDDVTVAAVRSADISVDKDASNVQPAPGAQVSFTVGVKNSGPSDAATVTLTDVLPNGMTYVSDSQNCGAAALAAGCNLGPLAAGQTREVTIVAQVAANAQPGTILTNNASATSSEPDPDATDNADSAFVIVTQAANAADLAIDKTASDPTPLAGEAITFDLAVTNNGPATAQAVVVQDTLPAQVTPGALPAACALAAGTVTCNLGNIANGTTVVVQIPVTVGAGLAAGTQFNNTATVTSNTPDPQGSNNSDTITLIVESPSPNVDLAVTKTASDNNPIAGTTLQYTLAIRNHGPGTANGVVVTDNLPAGVSLVDNDGGCTAVAQVLTCNLGTVADDTTVTIHVNVAIPATATQGQQFVNTASVATTSPETDPTDNQANHTATARRVADLRIDKTANPATAQAGGQVVFGFQIDNLGPSNAGPVTVTDTLPPGLTHVSNTAGCSVSGQTLTCTFPTVTAGGFVSFQVTAAVAANASGTVTNTATVSSPAADPAPGNNSDSVNVTITAPQNADVRISKNVNGTTPAQQGGLVTYDFVVVNDGPGQALNVVVSDALPAQVTHHSNTAGCQVSGQNVTCNLGTVNGGQTRTFQIVVRIGAAVAPGTQVSNTASVTSTTPDPNAANNGAQATFIVLAAPSPPLNAACNVLPGGAQIRVTWVDNSTFETEFAIEVSFNGSTYIPLATVPSTTQVGTGTLYAYESPELLASTSYTFRVAARDAVTGQVSAASVPTDGCTTASQPVEKTSCIRGYMNLQGRSDHTGAVVYVDGVPAGLSGPNGYFSICGVPKGEHRLSADAACYLGADQMFRVSGGGPLDLPFTALPGGDTDNNAAINLFDLVRVGANYRTSPPSDIRADCNGDREVNLFDLVLVGTNYGRNGSVPFGYAGEAEAAARLFGAVAPSTARKVDGALAGILPPAAERALGLPEGAPAAPPAGPIDVALGVRAIDSDTIAVDVTAEGVWNLYGAEVKMKFDPQRVKVVDALEVAGVQVKPGEAWSREGQPFIAVNKVDPSGSIGFTATRVAPARGMYGDIVLFTVTFDVLKDGADGAWSIDSALLVDGDNHAIETTIDGKSIQAVIDRNTFVGRALLPALYRGLSLR